MRRRYKKNAGQDAPTADDLTSDGYPSEGDLETGATIPGPYWYHLVTEAIVQVIEEAGLDPDDDAAQFKDALVSYVAAQIADINIPVPPTSVTLASVNEHTQNNPPGNEAATPLGVKAMIDRLIDGAPGALNTLNELAAAIGDDSDYAGTITTALAAKANLDDVGGGVAGGVVNKSANYQVAAADDGETVLVSAAAAARTVTLPNIGSGEEGFTVTVVKTDSSVNAVTIDGHGEDLVNGAATYTLKDQHEALILKWTGSAWIALGGATGEFLRGFFGDASRREWTTAGSHSYSWEWDTPNGLAILLVALAAAEEEEAEEPQARGLAPIRSCPPRRVQTTVAVAAVLAGQADLAVQAAREPLALFHQGRRARRAAKAATAQRAAAAAAAAAPVGA